MTLVRGHNQNGNPTRPKWSIPSLSYHRVTQPEEQYVCSEMSQILALGDRNPFPEGVEINPLVTVELHILGNCPPCSVPKAAKAPLSAIEHASQLGDHSYSARLFAGYM